MSESEDAIRLANHILDIPNEDPDSYRCMLARQFLRAREEVEAWRDHFPACFYRGKGIEFKFEHTDQEDER